MHRHSIIFVEYVRNVLSHVYSQDAQLEVRLLSDD